jgi:hypothetical protein
MRDLAVERRLLAAMPVVKFMHGYNGTCLSGQKRFGVPLARPCGRRFGAACLALYVPRRCGPLGFSAFAEHLALRADSALLTRYRTIVVASQHMKTEYVRGGVDERRVQVNPLFSTHQRSMAVGSEAASPTVAFCGRINLKGGDLLVRAVADASRLGTPFIIMIGDGPQRARGSAWRRGWVSCHLHRMAGRRCEMGLAAARGLLAVPSTWPEPFGLVGLEAGSLGVPAIAFDVGGIREWLTPGENGFLVPGNPPRAANLPRAGRRVPAARAPARASRERAEGRAASRSTAITTGWKRRLLVRTPARLVSRRLRVLLVGDYPRDSGSDRQSPAEAAAALQTSATAATRCSERTSATSRAAAMRQAFAPARTGAVRRQVREHGPSTSSIWRARRSVDRACISAPSRHRSDLPVQRPRALNYRRMIADHDAGLPEGWTRRWFHPRRGCRRSRRGAPADR